MVEHRSPKPRVVGSSPIAPAIYRHRIKEKRIIKDTAVKPVKFYKEVKSEMNKVAWPTRKETITTSIMVFIFVFLAALFLFSADQIISVIVKFILGIGA